MTFLLRSAYTQTDGCLGCVALKEELWKLNNQLVYVRCNLAKQKTNVKKLKQRLERTQNPTVVDAKEDPCHIFDADHDISEDSDDEGKYEEGNSLYEPEGDDSDPDDDLHSDEEDESCTLTVEGNIRQEAKHIVFLSKLLLLFNICFACKADNPRVITRQIGTMVDVKASCCNPECGYEFKWCSQPFMASTRIPAGNLLLSMATLFAGGSISKIRTIFNHMGIGCISLVTFFKYQRTMLFPAIHLYWTKYQQNTIREINASCPKVAISGDGRHDSMGHSAKYGAYSLFCNTKPSVIHFELVQKNEAGSSQAMELFGFKKAMASILQSGMSVLHFISDRHLSIAANMREEHSDIIHHFDLWHLKKKIRKVLNGIAKQKDCEIVSDWVQSCINHLHWSATTTEDGDGDVILAKFKVFLSHILDKHTDLNDQLFNKCAHGEIGEKRWLTVDSIPYRKVEKALTDKRLSNGIKMASPLSQTSFLEGFHSVINQFAPKMIAYSHSGMYCRIY